MTFECNKGHIAIIYGSQPCPLCSSHETIDRLRDLLIKTRPFTDRVKDKELRDEIHEALVESDPGEVIECPHRDETCDPACREWPDAYCPDGPPEGRLFNTSRSTRSRG